MTLIFCKNGGNRVYYYNIANIGIELNTNKKFNHSTKFKKFEIDYPKFEKLNNKVRFEISNNDIPKPNKEKVIYREVESCLQLEEDKDIWFLERNNPNPYCCHINYRNGIHKIYIEENSDYKVKEMWQVFAIMDLVNLLGQFDTLILHSSFIPYKEKGILFTGSSGIGKSTQADLWQKYEKTEIINGDRSVINKIDGKWYAYGFPYSGSSNHCLNKKYEIRLIVALEQGDINKIVRLNGFEKFKYVYSQIAINKWDKDLNIKIIDLVRELTNDVEIIKLSCKPDQEAIDILKRFIEEESLI